MQGCVGGLRLKAGSVRGLGRTRIGRSEGEGALGKGGDECAETC